MTTLIRPRNFALATDRPVVSPRFAPGLSTTHGGVPTGDPDVSPDQTFPGWLPQFARSSHAIWMSPSALGARADGHTLELHHHQRHHPPNGCVIPARALTAAIDEVLARVDEIIAVDPAPPLEETMARVLG